MEKPNPKTPPASAGQRPAADGPATTARPASSPSPRAAASSPPSKPAKPAGPAPLYRRIDWFAFAVTTLVTMAGYFYTLAPDLTLEDCGELAVGSFYSGVPHPPGYPVWTILSWLFTVLIPFSNVAFRVALMSAASCALSCGLLALMVSRGSSMIIEGMAELKGLERRWENAICIVSGFVAGMLLAFNGFLWSQAVIVEVYTLSVLSLMGVLCCLLRWVYAPEQRRYLYVAFILFGICFTNHQTLIVATMGLEVAVMLVHPKLGRDLFFGNSVAYILGLIAKSNGSLSTFNNNVPLFAIYNVIGIGSIVTCGWLILKTKGLLTEWKSFLIMTGLWILGASFYFYMPIASMTNPPMNWGYARTAEGFVHALTRGQYDRTKPTNSLGAFIDQLRVYGEGATEEFNFVYLMMALIPLAFFWRMQKRERAWLGGLTAIFLCMSLGLDLLLNPTPDKQSRDLCKVFFTASYIMIAMFIGYGLTLVAASLMMQYQRFRTIVLYGVAVAAAVAIYDLARAMGPDNFNPLALYTAILGVALAGIAIGALVVARVRAPMAVVLALFALLPTVTIFSHWADNEQRGHLFGFWFGHDMFTPPFTGSDGQPLYPEMTRNAILFGGTDPGRFCPTYMIFCESFIPPAKRRDPKFDRRDVYIITQNALADATYLSYIRAHYNRSAQIDSPFFQEFFHTRLLTPLDRFFTNLGAKVEKRRRTEGVYPPVEIYTPSVDDSRRTFDEYMADFQKRMQANQLKPGEDFKIIEDKIQVSGQVSVMQINGLLTKIIFDKNPTNEFFVEESFPLDWMYPYQTPFGIIMKINREPVPELTEDMVKRDHEFWSKYSDRLTGNWITYDTSVKEICDFVQRVYLHRDYRGFRGDPKFVRDNDAQKAFSKLRSAIAGLYSFRVNNPKSALEQQRMLKEADFAFRQSYCYCPYSPEALYRYVQLLASPSVGRYADAALLARTSLLFDPENKGIRDLVSQLEGARQGQVSVDQAQAQLQQFQLQYQTNPTNVQTALNLAMYYNQLQRTNEANEVLNRLIPSLEQQYKLNPSNPSAAFGLASAYIQGHQYNRALELLDALVANPKADTMILLTAANAYAQLGQVQKLEFTLAKLVQLVPDNPEAWYDLAAVQATLGKNDEAIQSLRRAFPLSAKRLAQQPKAKDLVATAASDQRFNALRLSPEFQKLLAEKY